MHPSHPLATSSHHYGSFRPASGSFKASNQSSIPLQNSMQRAPYDLSFNSAPTSPLFHSHSQPTTPPQASTASHQIPSNSPIPIAGDLMAILQEYLDWQVVKNPSQESQLWEAFEKLGKEMYIYFDRYSKI